MAIEIVDFPIKNGGFFHSYVSLPETMVFSHQIWTVPAASPGFIPLPPFPGRPTDPFFAAAELQWAKWSIICRYLFVSSNVVISCNPSM